MEVYRYLQEGSADHISWQTLAKKSGFINQFMRGDKSLRTMEDIAADDLSPDQMVALATGDETMMKRLGLEQEVRRLERLASRHKQQQYKIGRTLETAPETRAKHVANVEKVKGIVSQFQKDFHFVDTSTGKEFNSASKEAQQAFANNVKAAKEYYEKNNSYYTRRIGKYKGMDITTNWQGNIYIEVPTEQGRNIEYPVGSTLQSVTARDRLLPKEQARYEQMVTDFDRDMEQLSKSKGQDFKHAGTLVNKKAELGKLLAKMEERKQLAAKAAKIGES